MKNKQIVSMSLSHDINVISYHALHFMIRLHIDGGVWDSGGLMALPSVPASNLIVNIVCGRGRIGSSVLPDRFKDARVRL